MAAARLTSKALGVNINSKVVATADKTFFKFSTPAEDGDITTIKRKCNVCGERIADDTAPRFFTVRSTPKTRGFGTYNLRRIYIPVTIVVGSLA